MVMKTMAHLHVLMYVFVICGLSISTNSVNRIPYEARCYIETLEGMVEESCDITHEPGVCPSLVETPAQRTTATSIDISAERTREGVYLMNVSLPLHNRVNDWLILMISAVMFTNEEELCMTIVSGLTESGPMKKVALHIQLVEFPRGAYNFTLLGNPSVSLLPGEMLSGKKASELHPLSHRRFSLGSKLRLHHRVRRTVPSPTCFFGSTHTYSADHYVLKFNFSQSDSSCINIPISLLYIKKDDIDERKCLNFRSERPPANLLRNRTTEYASKSPVEFSNVPSGCYLIHAPGPRYYGFFWLNAINFPQIREWNTNIGIKVKSSRGSIEIRWTIPDYPLNFSSWRLRLWHDERSKFECSGRDAESMVTANYINENAYTESNCYIYRNLTKGYYCAWLIPVDGRCSTNGCPARATDTILLNDPPSLDPPPRFTLPTWAVCIFVGVGVVIGMGLALLCYTFSRSSLHQSSPNEPAISKGPNRLDKGKVSVLIIWTLEQLDKDFEKVISTFKHLLTTYSKCKVYDYQDYCSMDSWERQALLMSPSEWLLNHFKNPNEKIIFVGSQKTGKSEVTKSIITRTIHEEVLFDCALRYLRESLELSSNYSRMFYVRFPGLYKPENDLKEIVPWMRFDIPTHLRSLTLRLRGLSEELSCTYPDPPENEVINLQALINNCKNNYK